MSVLNFFFLIVFSGTTHHHLFFFQNDMNRYPLKSVNILIYLNSRVKINIHQNVGQPTSKVIEIVF